MSVAQAKHPRKPRKLRLSQEHATAIYAADMLVDFLGSLNDTEPAKKTVRALQIEAARIAKILRPVRESLPIDQQMTARAAYEELYQAAWAEAGFDPL